MSEYSVDDILKFIALYNQPNSVYTINTDPDVDIELLEAAKKFLSQQENVDTESLLPCELVTFVIDNGEELNEDDEAESFFDNDLIVVIFGTNLRDCFKRLLNPILRYKKVNVLNLNREVLVKFLNESEDEALEKFVGILNDKVYDEENDWSADYNKDYLNYIKIVDREKFHVKGNYQKIQDLVEHDGVLY